MGPARGSGILLGFRGSEGVCVICGVAGYDREQENGDAPGESACERNVPFSVFRSAYSICDHLCGSMLSHDGRRTMELSRNTTEQTSSERFCSKAFLLAGSENAHFDFRGTERIGVRKEFVEIFDQGAIDIFDEIAWA